VYDEAKLNRTSISTQQTTGTTNHRRKQRSKINEKAAIATLKASMDSWSKQTDTFTAVANSSQNPKTLNAT
jgi:hypothetical protein